MLIVLAVALLALPVAANAATVIVDTFDATSLNPMWTFEKDAAQGGSWIDRDDGCMAGHTGCSKRLK